MKNPLDRWGRVCYNSSCSAGVAHLPMRYSELPRFYRENVTVDVAMIQVAPMDSHGNFKIGRAHV